MDSAGHQRIRFTVNSTIYTLYHLGRNGIKFIEIKQTELGTGTLPPCPLVQACNRVEVCKANIVIKLGEICLINAAHCEHTGTHIT